MFAVPFPGELEFSPTESAPGMRWGGEMVRLDRQLRRRDSLTILSARIWRALCLFTVTFIVLYDQTADISERGLLCEMRLAAARVAFLLTESCS